MTAKHLGEQLDIHGGAQDLKFPHHENEIAQSEAASGKAPFVRYWLHSGFLNVQGEKMSKSLGNYIEIQDLLKKCTGKEFRFFVAQMHYRSHLDFRWENLEKTNQALERLNNLIQRLQEVTFEGKIFIDDWNPKGENVKAHGGTIVWQHKIEFENAMNDDFNFSNAWAQVYLMEKEINSIIGSRSPDGKEGFTKGNAKEALDFFRSVDSIFQVFEWPQSVVLSKQEQALFDLRQKLKKEKKYSEADQVRAQLLTLGIQIDDTKDGSKLRRIK